MNGHSIPHLHSASAPRVCPFAAKHGYCAPQKGDSRSVCPALNTMANHGYLPRNGDDVSLLDLICALQECYGLTWPLAAFLAIGGYVLLRWWPWRVFRLEEIGKHGAVEHDASLVHEDARGRPLAPTRIHPHLVTALAEETVAAYEEDSHESRDGVVWTSYHAARARVRREKESPPLDAVHAEIARGEIAIMLCVWEYAFGEPCDELRGIPLEWWLKFLAEERLPEGVEGHGVRRRVGILDVVRKSGEIRSGMEYIRQIRS
ncbi:Cloroperoxidase [Schizophyllum commune Loenen D]|nr:Cloroperoxidase [Schizophyllum commune Loenen D]